jgi:hypothetical protein
MPFTATLTTPYDRAKGGRTPMARHITNQNAPTSVLPDELLTIEEAAARLNMSVRYIRRAVAERQIAFHRLPAFHSCGAF